ncbi:MAG: ATP-binding protein [Anaerolineaceae bacterium]
MIIPRYLLSHLKEELAPGRAYVIYGPRQVGKTTLVKQLINSLSLKSKYINADELMYREALSSQSKQMLGDVLGENELLIIDEAQRIPDIGINLKILIDNFPQAYFLVTGSASLTLANKISEPLTGRKLTYNLFPVSFSEVQQTYGKLEAKDQLERWLIWGGYPAIVIEENRNLRERLLSELVGSYLYRDMLELEEIRRSERIVDLLRLLAFQIGNEVSINELANSLNLNFQTVGKYLDLLEKVFVIFKVRGYSRNLRKEVTKNARYYFYDNGVRNSIIQNFNSLSNRNDVGQLWENYLVVERLKANQATSHKCNYYFWRTYDQKEIDWLEEYGGKLQGYEFKWKADEIRKSIQNEFLTGYPGSQLSVIHQNNFESFLDITEPGLL